MYRSKYNKYITHGQSRFAEPNEIIGALDPVTDGNGKHAAGVPLYYENGTLYVDNSDFHSIIVGPTGCKKTRTTVFSTLASIIAAGESALVNDPKGEIYCRTANLAKETGAQVYVLNFRNPECSNGWNPLTQASRLYNEGKVTEATQCVNDFVDAICSASESHTTDRYWIDCAKAELNALILMLVASVAAEYCNLSNLIPMCYESNADSLSEILPEMDQTSAAAFGLHTVLDLSADRTKSCVYSMLLSVMTPFTQNQGLQRMLCESSFDIMKIGEEQTIIYVIYPDEKNSLSFLVNAFFTQCYEMLVLRSSEKDTKRLPVRVNFILEEFSNLPPISCFENRISEARSRNIRYFLYIQSYEQLKQKYGGTAETILSNCSNWLCFSSKESAFLEKISAVCGKEIDYNGIEHDLISPFEMQHLIKAPDYAEVLIIRQSSYPYVAQLPDIDYVEPYKHIKPVRLPKIAPDSNAKTISFEEWYSGINSGKFAFPFPKADRPTQEEFSDIQAKLEAKFDELFG